MEELKNIIIKNRLAIVFALIFIVFEILLSANIIDLRMLDVMAIRVLFTSVIGLLLIFPPSGNKNKITDQRYDNFKFLLSIFVPILALSTITFFAISPIWADSLAMEDEAVENLSAIFLFIGSIVMLISSVYFVRSKNYLGLVVSLLAATILFVICMEEVSWLQRVVDRESSDFFLENNIQGETNLHNMATNLFEMAYYFGAFLLLTVVPLFQNSLKGLFSKIHLKSLNIFISSSWLSVPFAVIAGFMALSGLISSISYLLMTVITVLVLIYIIKNSRDNLYLPLLSLLIICLGFTVFSFTDYSSVRTWAYSEYREFFIALGLAVYSIDVLFKTKIGKTN